MKKSQGTKSESVEMRSLFGAGHNTGAKKGGEKDDKPGKMTRGALVKRLGNKKI